MIVRDCLGREREPSEVYPDGSYNCPFCYAAVLAGTPGCPNPACFARVEPPFPADLAQRILDQVREREREAAERAANQAWAADYAARRRAEELTRLANITQRALSTGACVDCAIKSAGVARAPKYTKHRNGCPRKRA